MFCRSLFVLLSFFFLSLCCLFFFNLRILITPLVPSSSSYMYTLDRVWWIWVQKLISYLRANVLLYKNEHDFWRRKYVWRTIRQWASGWLLLNAKWTICQLYNGENPFHFALYQINTLGWIFIVLASSSGRYVTPHGHIILNPSQPLFDLTLRA